VLGFRLGFRVAFRVRIRVRVESVYNLSLIFCSNPNPSLILTWLGLLVAHVILYSLGLNVCFCHIIA
jgi:hypothetical protein